MNFIDSNKTSKDYSRRLNPYMQNLFEYTDPKDFENHLLRIQKSHPKQNKKALGKTEGFCKKLGQSTIF